MVGGTGEAFSHLPGSDALASLVDQMWGSCKGLQQQLERHINAEVEMMPTEASVNGCKVAAATPTDATHTQQDTIASCLPRESTNCRCDGTAGLEVKQVRNAIARLTG